MLPPPSLYFTIEKQFLSVRASLSYIHKHYVIEFGKGVLLPGLKSSASLRLLMLSALSLQFIFLKKFSLMTIDLFCFYAPIAQCSDIICMCTE